MGEEQDLKKIQQEIENLKSRMETYRSYVTYYDTLAKSLSEGSEKKNARLNANDFFQKFVKAQEELRKKEEEAQRIRRKQQEEERREQEMDNSQRAQKNTEQDISQQQEQTQQEEHKGAWQRLRDWDRKRMPERERQEWEDLQTKYKNLEQQLKNIEQRKESYQKLDEEIKELLQDISQNGDPNGQKTRRLNEKNQLKQQGDKEKEQLEQAKQEYEKQQKELEKQMSAKKGYAGKALAGVTSPITSGPVRAAFNSAKGAWGKWRENRQEKKKARKDRRQEKRTETLQDRAERKKNEQEEKQRKKDYKKQRRQDIKEKVQARGGELFILLAVIVHLMKFGMGFNVAQTWFIDVAFALVVWLVFFDDNKDKNPKGIRALSIVLALEIALPLIIGNFHALATNKYVHYYFANRLLTPWWFYFAIIWANNATSPTRIARFIKTIVVLFWIGVLLGSLPAVTFSKMSPADYMGQQQTDRAVDFYHKSKAFWFEDVWGAIERGGASIFDAWEKQMAAATGGYYTGMVDRNSDKKLGVYIERVQPTSPEFFYDSPVSVQGNIEIMSLADSVLLNVSCYYGGKGEYGSFDEAKRATEVYPEEARWYYNREKEQVDCMFEPGYLPRGSHKVTVTSGFNFETMAYQKAYFMQKERMRALIGQGKDPLSEYGIKDKEPKAKYTAGPVMIGMDVSNLPVSVSENKNNRPRVGVTIESNTGWKGRIKELKELVIEVPDSMSIDTNSCNYEFEKAVDKDKDSLIEKFREERTREFEECMDKVGLGEEDIGDEGYIDIKSPGSTLPRNFKKCLQDKAEQKRENEGSKKELMEGYREFRSSQFRDCLEQTGLTNDMFKNNGELKNEYNEQEGIKEFNKCLNEYAEKETEGYRLYYLNLDKYPEEFKNIERYKTFSCRMNIDEPDEILGGRPVATHHLRAKARYDYQLEKSTRVQVIGSGATEPYELPEGLPSKHMQIRRDYGTQIQERIKTINNNADFNEKVSKILSQCLIQAQIIHESGGDPKAINNNDPSYGLMQVMKPTKEQVVRELKNKDIKPEGYEADLMNVEDNILIGTYYIAKQINIALERGASDEDAIKYALAQYNHGPGDVLDDCGSVGEYVNFDVCYSRLPDITQNYVDGITESKDVCEEEGYDEKQELPNEDEWDSSKWDTGQMQFDVKYGESTINDIINYWERNNPQANVDNENVKELLYDRNKLDEQKEKLKLARCIIRNNGAEACNEYEASDVKDYYTKETVADDKEEYNRNDKFYNKEGEVKSTLRIKNDYKPRAIKKSERLGNQRLFIRVPKQSYYPEEEKIRAKLMFNQLIEMDQERFKKTETMSNIGKNPFVRARFAGCKPKKEKFECTLNYKFARSFVENSGEIGHDKEKSLNSLLDIRFEDDWGTTNSIEILNKQGREICSVHWPTYSKPKKCINEDYPYGLGITIRDAFDERVGEDLRKNNANVQVEYNTKNFNANCCTKPEDCGEFALGTCNEKKAKEVDCHISQRGENAFICSDLRREVHSS